MRFFSQACGDLADGQVFKLTQTNQAAISMSGRVWLLKRKRDLAATRMSMPARIVSMASLACCSRMPRRAGDADRLFGDAGGVHDHQVASIR